MLFCCYTRSQNAQLHLVNCAFSVFANLKTTLFFNLSTKEGNPVLFLGCPLLSYVSRYFVLFFFMKSMISEIYPNAMPTTVSAAP